jgi:ferredoxin
MQLRVIPDVCNLFALCVEQAPELFSIDDAGELEYVVDVPLELEQRALLAARSCPTGAIELRME